MKDVFTWLKSTFAGLIGAAVAGGVTGATQAITTGNVDGNVITGAAVAGAAVAIGNYLTKSPRQ